MREDAEKRDAEEDWEALAKISGDGGAHGSEKEEYGECC